MIPKSHSFRYPFVYSNLGDFATQLPKKVTLLVEPLRKVLYREFPLDLKL